MFGGIGTGEIILLLAIALIVIGPKKLPEVARTIGRGLAELRRASYDLQRNLSLEELDRPPFHSIPDARAREQLRKKTSAESLETGETETSGTPRPTPAVPKETAPSGTHEGEEHRASELGTGATTAEPRQNEAVATDAPAREGNGVAPTSDGAVVDEDGIQPASAHGGKS